MSRASIEHLITIVHHRTARPIGNVRRGSRITTLVHGEREEALNYPSKLSAAVLPRWNDTAVLTPRWSGFRAAQDEDSAGACVGLTCWKRALDVVLSVIALIVLAPLIGIVSALVKLTSPGPVVFMQERIGVDRRTQQRRRASYRRAADDRRNDTNDRRVLVKFGQPFTIYKFRTMVAGAEKGKPVFAQQRDPRVTALGRFLRKTRIDEIPQFVNVLKGDMSIVGPRPERAYFIGEARKDIPDFHRRLRTRPGITGLAQVKLGYTNDMVGLQKKLQYDLEYIDALRPVTDFKILAQTVRVVLTGKGAY